MARSSKKRVELGQAAPLFSAAGQKQVERLLKKAADQAANDAKRRWKRVGRNPFAKHALYTIGAFEQAFRNALKGALNHHANNSGPRPSIRMTAPDTGGRPFHFEHTIVTAGGASSTYKAGTVVAHMDYIDRDSAVERIVPDQTIDALQSSEQIDDAPHRDRAERMQGYIEDPEKVEAPKTVAEGGQAQRTQSFSFGNIGDTKEDRRAFWALVEQHAERSNARLQGRIVLELPSEATPGQRLAIVRRYAAGLARRRLRYHATLHAPTNKNDPRNFHAHIVYMSRPAKKIDFAFDGFDDGTDKPKGKIWDFAAVTYLPDGNKHRRPAHPHRQKVHPDTQKPTFIPDERRRFAEIVNDVMQKAGNPVRYDHRSYKAMGIDVEAVRSFSRIAADKAKSGKRLILDEGRTKRDIEAEVTLLARERAPEVAEISKVRAAVRQGDRELRQLEKEGEFLKGKPIVRRAAHVVRTFVKEKALDYARTRALHVERSIEAAQEVRALERVIEATQPEKIAELRGRLAQSLVAARRSCNKREVARLKKELKVVPKTAHAAILNRVAANEVEALRARHDRRGVLRLAKVRMALREWRAAAAGARLQPPQPANSGLVRVAGVPVATKSPPVEIKLPQRKQHPIWTSYDQVVEQTFQTGFQKYMAGVFKRYGQFILDNADESVPGRTALELADKLAQAVKLHPAQADALIMTHDLERRAREAMPKPRVVYAEAPERPSPAADEAPAFSLNGRMPRPAAGEVEPMPDQASPLQRDRAPQSDAAVPAAALTPPRDGARTAKPPETPEPEEFPLDGEEVSDRKRKKRSKRQERQRGILAHQSRARARDFER